MTNIVVTIMLKQDKVLLLLGILRSHESHGYELHALLDSAVMPIHIGKANAYQILSQFEERGWVTASEEREGNRPPRRVYAVTPAGEEAFQRMLRERVPVHISADHADAVSLNFLSLLPPHEAVELLARRLDALQRQFSELSALVGEGDDEHYGVDYALQHARFERDWLQALIDKLAGQTEEPSAGQRTP